MKLRTRIFLLVGGLFALSTLLSLVLEEYFASRSVHKSEEIIHNKITEANTEKREALKKYLSDVLFHSKAQTDALIDRVQNVSFISSTFKPSKLNINTNTWLSSANLLTNNKRIDFIQCMINQKLTSLIVLDHPPHSHSTLTPFFDDVVLCRVDPEAVDHHGTKQSLFIGIPFNYNAETYKTTRFLNAEIKQASHNSVFYLIYDIHSIVNIDEKELEDRVAKFLASGVERYSSQVSVTLEQLVALKKAVRHLKDRLLQTQQHLKSHPHIVEQFIRKEQNLNRTPYKSSTLHRELSDTADEEIKTRYHQINMVWQLCCLSGTGLYDYTPFHPMFPKGLAMVEKNHINGFVLLADDVFFNQPVELLGDSLFLGPQKRVFLGNSLSLSDQHNQGVYVSRLSIGKDLFWIFKNLAQAVQENTMLVYDKKILKAFDSHGQEITSNVANFPIDEVLENSFGSIKGDKGHDIIYITIKPFQDQNVAVVVFNKKNKIFTLLNVAKTVASELDSSLSLMIAAVSFLMFLIAIVFINRISGHITEPISVLAKATSTVADGELDKIDLPSHLATSEDEVKELYDSFANMIQGLKEKEKVKGILNKVVSPQVANKILEGQVTLGGEERIVTVLFADIRNFTEITETMKPSDLIHILNHYMTIMSSCIDEYEGVIDKYVGDEVMALFGAPIYTVDSALKAVQCGIKMVQRVHESNLDRTRQGHPIMNIGIGIHTGMVVAGNMGAENRLNYTVLGANVNMASRICSASKESEVLISQGTLDAYGVKDNCQAIALEPLTLKGFSEPVKIYKIELSLN